MRPAQAAEAQGRKMGRKLIFEIKRYFLRSTSFELLNQT
jgi:hypothetical protein